MQRRRERQVALGVLAAGLAVVVLYYARPAPRISPGVQVDHIVVHKSRHLMELYSGGRLVQAYPVSIGRGGPGPKEFEGDGKTPEGRYVISDKNGHSGWYKNLGISYPNDEDRKRAASLGKTAGSEIKIHGLKNGQGWIGRFQRWRDWTNGCIGLTDDEMDQVYAHVAVGTPIDLLPD